MNVAVRPEDAVSHQPLAAPFLAGFRSLLSETTGTWVNWDGEAPSWLSGDLLRTGPALFEVGGRPYRHWFDGLAMLYRFALAPDGVAYTNRFLRSESFAAAIDDHRVMHGGFATNSDSPYWRRVMDPVIGRMTDNANVNVFKFGEDDFVALTEVPRAMRFDRQTLATLGALTWDDQLKSHTMTAHPLRDAWRRVVYNLETVFSVPSLYRLTRMADGVTTREVVAEIRVDHPAYMHSFAMSRNYLILVECPLVVHPLRMLLRSGPFISAYRWTPERGTCLTVVDKDSGTIVRRCLAEPCFGFHVVNAFEQDGTIAVDFVAYPDAAVVGGLALDRLRTGARQCAGMLTRFTVSLDTGTSATSILSDSLLELPHFDWRRQTGIAYRYVWAVGQSGAAFINDLQKHDLRCGTIARWSEPGCYAGEPVFVAAPEAEAEDDGIILSVVLDSQRHRSFLLLLDAATMTEQARAWMPHAIPFGFHGNHYPVAPRAQADG